MARFGDAVGLLAFGQQPGTNTRHQADCGQHQETAGGVVEQVKADHQLLGAVAQAVHPGHQRVEHGHDQQQANQLVQQAAQGHLAACRVLHIGTEKRQHAAADIGANHQADGDMQADNTRTGQGGGQQHGRQAGVGHHCEQGADQSIEQDIAGQRSKNHLHALGMGDGCGSFDDQLQRQDDQAQANAYPPQLPGAGLLAGQKENHTQENQQRRQPRQVEGQHPGHQCGPDIGAEHGGQGRGQCH